MEIEVGKQYKTRGGWRAVVVDTYKDEYFLVWHVTEYSKTSQREYSKTFAHNGCGKSLTGIGMSDADLVEEWKEPEVIEGWVEIYGANIEEIDAAFYHNRANLENGVRNTKEFSRAKTFAVKRIKFEVGQRDDLEGEQ